MYVVPLLIIPLFIMNCAVLHHAQIGEIDNRAGVKRTSFDIKVSELGFSLKEAGKSAKMFGGKKDSEMIDDITFFIGLFQMGPATGKPVFVPAYARSIGEKVREACPSGSITGLTSIRETRNYPIISGEIVKVTGYCLTKQ